MNYLSTSTGLRYLVITHHSKMFEFYGDFDFEILYGHMVIEWYIYDFATIFSKSFQNLFKIFCMNVFRGQNILYISYSVLSQLYLGLECTTKYASWYIAKILVKEHDEKEASELFLISKDILLLTNLGEHWRFEILFVMV